MKCEACGLIGGDAEHIRVHTANGSLNLCRQCLDSINAKNPELAELRAAWSSIGRTIIAADVHPTRCATNNDTIGLPCNCYIAEIAALLEKRP